MNDGYDEFGGRGASALGMAFLEPVQPVGDVIVNEPANCNAALRTESSARGDLLKAAEEIFAGLEMADLIIREMEGRPHPDIADEVTKHMGLDMTREQAWDIEEHWRKATNNGARAAEGVQKDYFYASIFMAMLENGLEHVKPDWGHRAPDAETVETVFQEDMTIGDAPLGKREADLKATILSSIDVRRASLYVVDGDKPKDPVGPT